MYCTLWSVGLRRSLHPTYFSVSSRQHAPYFPRHPHTCLHVQAIKGRTTLHRSAPPHHTSDPHRSTILHTDTYVWNYPHQSMFYYAAMHFVYKKEVIDFTTFGMHSFRDAVSDFPWVEQDIKKNFLLPPPPKIFSLDFAHYFFSFY